MSTGDEIVFGEMTYREPMRLRRPDRDRRKTCIAYETPGPDDLPIFLERKPADAIERHALQDTSVELGGILLGKECVDDETGEPFVWITEALEAKHYENTQASFTYTHESWEEITRERDRKFPDLDVVGWYHTHPDFGVFLSSHDLFIHHHFFAQRLQVAYVVDPIRQTRGFFQWKDGQMQQVRGFTLSADRGERQALARLVNDLENIPNAEGGGGLSPRLEAELMAMLTRPHHAPAAVDRGQTAAVFSLLGVFVGALGVAVLLWLYTLGNSLRDQQDDLRALARAQQEAAKALEAAVGGARLSAKERALDAILDQVKLGATSESIREEYAQTMQQVVALQDKVARLDTEKEALHDRARDLQAKLDGSTKELVALREKSDRATQETADRLRESEARAEVLKGELAKVELQLKEGETGALVGRYNLVFWAAVGGWMAFFLSLLGVVALWQRLPAEEEPPSNYSFQPPQPPPASPGAGSPQNPTVPNPRNEPPHVIE